MKTRASFCLTEISLPFTLEQFYVPTDEHFNANSFCHDAGAPCSWQSGSKNVMRNLQAYFKPATVPAAVQLFREQPGRGQYIAGGTQVAAAKTPALDYLVDLTTCGLNYIQAQDGRLRIGACVTLAELAQSDLIGAFANGIIATAARWTGSSQLRNSATAGGRLIAKDDLALPLLALDAQLVVVGETERTVPLAAFYGNSTEMLREGEVIKECILPGEFRPAAGSVLRMSQTQQDVALIAVAATVIVVNGICQKARIAVKPVVSGVMRVLPAEAMLEGQTVTGALIERVAATVAQTIQPLADYRASAEYRRQMSRVYVKRALSECFKIGA